MTKKTTIQNTQVYLHQFNDKDIYAFTADLATIEKIVNQLYDKYNKVEQAVQINFISKDIPVYAEITCRDKIVK